MMRPATRSEPFTLMMVNRNKPLLICPNVASWLQAAVRRIMIYVGFTFSSGHADAEYPLLEALRTKPGVPRPAAYDPKRNWASEP